jgi:hypothetical protein
MLHPLLAAARAIGAAHEVWRLRTERRHPLLVEAALWKDRVRELVPVRAAVALSRLDGGRALPVLTLRQAP